MESELEIKREKHIMFLSIQLYQMQNNREIAHKIVTSTYRNKTCIETCSQEDQPASSREKSLSDLNHIREK